MRYLVARAAPSVAFATESPPRDAYSGCPGQLTALAVWHKRHGISVMRRFLLGHRAAPRSRRYRLCAWERAMNDVAAEVRDILVFHLGADERRLTDDARLSEDLGADSLDVVEIVMSCEERFAIAIPNRVATRLATVGDTVRFIESRLA
jgi:acyl carrier protein